MFSIIKMTQYHGGKQRIGEKLAKIMTEKSVAISEDEGWTIKGYCEPFCGMLGVYQHVPDMFKDYELKYKAGDQNKSVIIMWKEAQKGWCPSTKLVSREKFMTMKYDGKSSAEKGFVGHFYGYMGKYFQPFDSRRTIATAKRSSDKVSKIATNLKKVSFTSGSYTRYSNLKDYVIYCDPPYAKQSHYYTEFGDHVVPFNHEEFWDWCRMMSENNLVFISEYDAPLDFIKVSSTSSQTTGRNMIENLFLIK